MGNPSTSAMIYRFLIEGKDHQGGFFTTAEVEANSVQEAEVACRAKAEEQGWKLVEVAEHETVGRGSSPSGSPRFSARSYFG